MNKIKVISILNMMLVLYLLITIYGIEKEIVSLNKKVDNLHINPNNFTSTEPEMKKEIVVMPEIKSVKPPTQPN